MPCPIFIIGTYLLRYEGAVVEVTTEGLVVHNAGDQLLIILDIHLVLENRGFLVFRSPNLELLFVHCTAIHCPICSLLLLAQNVCPIFHRRVIYSVVHEL